MWRTSSTSRSSFPATPSCASTSRMRRSLPCGADNTVRDARRPLQENRKVGATECGLSGTQKAGYGRPTCGQKTEPGAPWQATPAFRVVAFECLLDGDFVDGPPQAVVLAGLDDLHEPARLGVEGDDRDGFAVF